MNRKKLVFWSTIAAAAAVAVAGAAASSGKHSAVTTVRAVSKPPTVVINKYIQDNLRWDKNVYKVPSGGTVHVVNVANDEGPHTFTVLARKDEPRTLAALFQCKICEKLGKAHGADPNSNAPPKFPYLENGVGQKTPPLVDRPGDSGVTGKGKKGESIDLKVTAPAGTKLHFICLIHPWMQAEVDVT